MNTILSIANGALQYHRGKQTGLAGLMGIIIALIIVFQWDSILPVLEALGIVDFLDRYGLIYEGEGYLTGYVLFMIAFRAAILFCVLIAILLVFAMIIGIVFSSDLGVKIAITVVGLLLSPFMFIYFMYDHFTTPKAIKEERYRQAMESKKPVVELLRESFELIDKDTAKAHLNRLPTTGDYHFLLAITENEEIFAVLPRARYRTENPVVKLKVERYDETKHKASFGEYQPKQFKVSYDHNGFNEKLQYDVLENKLDLADTKVEYLLKPNHEDFNHIFKWITNSQGFNKYMHEQIGNYFNRKQDILESISNADSKDVFDRLVALISEMDASNEDIVKLMWESKGIEA